MKKLIRYFVPKLLICLLKRFFRRGRRSIVVAHVSHFLSAILAARLPKLLKLFELFQILDTDPIRGFNKDLLATIRDIKFTPFGRFQNPRLGQINLCPSHTICERILPAARQSFFKILLGEPHDFCQPFSGFLHRMFFAVSGEF